MSEQPPTTKPWYQSKTMWFNLAAIVVLVITTIMDNQGMDVNAILDPETVTGIVAVVNLVLRFVTNQGVTVRSG